MPGTVTAALVLKLKNTNRLTQGDILAIEQLPLQSKRVVAHHPIVRDGDRPSQSCLIVDGFAFRSKLTPDGKRQVLSLHIPGEIPDRCVGGRYPETARASFIVPCDSVLSDNMTVVIGVLDSPHVAFDTELRPMAAPGDCPSQFEIELEQLIKKHLGSPRWMEDFIDIADALTDAATDISYEATEYPSEDDPECMGRKRRDLTKRYAPARGRD
ncbi:hypothetical protein AB7G19_22385 [Bradyrhizobium sp. 215_C5_N1_1]|uniref:hypothetical protein n=1 Tax=unclassified Bradyrhizobium TaxID=2631580 RepID=UPI003F89424F